ncbi:MAG: hypothetical protein NZT92_01245 [Abditibacteriales bacterium]|nr:hypothetical protein [Abditibacteriales bacterium]MDW8364541.1 hypothetical protein [Abditibacteriales bacterium]
MATVVKTEYKHLEARPHPWRKQLYIKGRNMTVWQLIAPARAENQTPEEVAKDRGLPLEAVLEAYNYYEKNKALIEAEVEEEKRRLIKKGYKLD